MANFKQLLSVDASTVEKPKPLPVGTYDGVITGHKFDESKEKKTPYCQVTIRGTAPGPDVDSDAFSQFGGATSLAKKELKIDFYLTEDSLYRFKAFFEEVLKFQVAGKTFDELSSQMDGNPVKFEITHSPSKDGSTVYANINRLLAA